jgi:hypothetical protein
MRTRWIVAAVMIVTGLVWLAQGLGLLRGSSFMVDDPRWAVGGLALLAGGIVVGWTAVRSRRQA